jgi:hypothetical protein
MRRLPSITGARGGYVGLPATVEELLVDMVNDGFALYCCGPKAAPNALVTCYEWDHYIDLLTIQDFDRIVTARMPKRESVDIFAPEVVVWAYEGPPQDALRALRELVHPAHPCAPTTEYPAPARLCVSRDQQRPMTIQLPGPSRSRVRAARLATAMTTNAGDRAVVSAAVLTGSRDSRLAAGRAGGPRRPAPDGQLATNTSR